jgi:hypothetical protein
MFTHSIALKPQHRPKNRWLSPLLTNFGKKCCRYIAGNLEAFYLFFALIFFTLTLATIFVSACFLPMVSKVKERSWKLNFRLLKWWKLAGVSKTIAAVATAFRVL